MRGAVERERRDDATEGILHLVLAAWSAPVRSRSGVR